MRREKLNWVYLITFLKVYTKDWTNCLFVHTMYLKADNLTWFEQNKNMFNLKMSIYF